MIRSGAALAAVLFFAALAAACFAPLRAGAQEARRGAFYAPREAFPPQSAAAAENVGGDVRFALTAEGDVLLYSNDRERLYLFDRRGAALKTLDLRAGNYTGVAFAAADVAAHPGGGCYIVEAGGCRVVFVSRDFKIASFASWHDRFSPGRLFEPSAARCDAAGNLLVHEGVPGDTRFFSAFALSPGPAFEGVAVPASDRPGSGERFSFGLSGATLEIKLVSASVTKRFASERFDGYADALFMAERAPSGGAAAGVRLIVNDRFEYRIVETDAVGAVRSNLPARFHGGAPRKAVMDAAGKILTVLPREAGAGGAAVMELVKTTPAAE